MYHITSHDSASTTIGIQNARARRLIGLSGTNGHTQTYTCTDDAITSTSRGAQIAPLVVGYVRRLTDALASPATNQPFTCTIEPAPTEEYDCVITVSPMCDEHRVDQLRRFMEREDALD